MADIRSGASTSGPATEGGEVDLLTSGADLVVTMDHALEIPGGWVAIRDGRVTATGRAGTEPQRAKCFGRMDAWSRRD